MLRRLALALTALSLAACATPAEDPFISDAIGRCTYVNGFNDRNECKEYLGSSWTQDAMQDNCESPVPGSDPGLLELDLGCPQDDLLGVCYVDAGTIEANTLYFLNGDGYDCSGLAVGCSFAGGEFAPAAACGGEDPLPPQGTTVFPPLELNCVDPIEGEPAGNGPDGQVCTWEAISASTEEGRSFDDYASCDTVRKQRPYYAVDTETGTPDDDPRYSDPEWQEEYEWVNSQVEASACICCHKPGLAPDGPSQWWLGQEGIWTDALSDEGVGMMAGVVDSTAFGAFHPDDNNGFSRLMTGMPSTQPKRMRAFFLDALARRGLTEADLADATPFGGPLYDQLIYEPGVCADDVGVAADGTMNWVGGRARYVYVLEADAQNPAVPPNLDLPDGTLWRVDVSPQDNPITDGIVYGEQPDGAFQAFPESGAPPELIAGEDYYLYVLADIYQPLTRCLFTAQ